MKKIWSPRIMQKYYKEWALEQSGKLLGKIRYNATTWPTYIGEVYHNGKTYTIYKGDNELMAREAVLRGY